MVNKIYLKEQLNTMIKADIEKQRQSFESARQASIDAPGRMQSRYENYCHLCPEHSDKYITVKIKYI